MKSPVLPMNPREILIDARDLWKSFDGGRISVIEGVDLRVGRGELVALWGTSGSGKSTLLNIIGTLDEPTGGSVSFAGVDPFSLKPKALARKLAHTHPRDDRWRESFQVFQQAALSILADAADVEDAVALLGALRTQILERKSV